MHAEVRIDDTVIMIADAGGAYPSFPVWLHVYVPDAQATYKKGLAAGGVAVQEPVHKPGDSDLRGGVKDPAATPGGSPRNELPDRNSSHFGRSPVRSGGRANFHLRFMHS